MNIFLMDPISNGSCVLSLALFSIVSVYLSILSIIGMIIALESLICNLLNYNNTNYIRNNTGSGFGISSINPTTQIKVPSSSKLKSNTSGFTGKPIASNSVTSSGGNKKKN